ncbi:MULTISPECIES: ribosomal protein S18-alanine N-acetyltransferase [Rhodobacterales]|uniref:ribosomal protein S18-alanine N-acetyltransferase n=1 Tax=Roseobacter sp. N2S TaxID=2663844 RepID=UPI002860D82D|nr:MULTISPECIES: ribosomal protein S18-alanine N-acetyltransferase [Rhodobacterales]MDR6265236.1 ribosomal-protein-alanine N-acetyltransferase [Roseobacter sp. N2S]
MNPAEMAAIHAACFTQPRPWSEAEFAELSASPQCIIQTAKLGFAIIRLAGPEAELLTIAVHPEARRQGLARSLLNALITDLNSRNCEEIFLEVVDDNTPAIQLYQSAGFENRAIRKDYYNGPNGQKSSALVMRKLL